jgi:DNA end-binding protein Ku
MAARATWKGHLKVSLVTIPIRVFPATDSAASVSFNQLHEECQTRIQQKKWCPSCEREVTNSEIVKGYEFAKGRYVVMTDEDIAKVRPESTRVIDLEQFTTVDQIDPIYFERPYYLAPDGKVAAQAFAVIREGMQGKAGIGRLALYGREYLVAVQPRENGLVMYTLRSDAEIRKMSAIDELDQVPAELKPGEVKLAQQVIGSFESDLDMSAFEDNYQTQLRKVIDAKVAGEDVVVQEEEAPAKVVDLMEALRRSLESVSTGKKKPAKATLASGSRAAAAKKSRKRASA